MNQDIPMNQMEKSVDGGSRRNTKKSVKLEAKMTLLNGCTVIIGTIIGSGIFVSPSGVLKDTGSVNLSLVVWTLSGLFSMVGAYCYSELGCIIRKNGADYAYIMTAFGPFLAFIKLWVECFIIRPCIIAIVSLTFALYAVKPFFPECDPSDTSIRILAFNCITFLAFINCWSVKMATRVQDVLTYAKILSLVMIIGIGIVQLISGKTENFTWDNTQTDVGSIASSFYTGLFAYSGWNYLNYLIEELKNPKRNLPLAIAISLPLVIGVYLLTNVAFYTTLNISEVLASQAVAVTFVGRIYDKLVYVIPVCVALSTFGGVNGTLLCSSRLFYAGAMENQLPQCLAMIQIKRKTPIPAVIIVAALSMLYLTSSSVFELITYTGFATWVPTAVSVACIPYLRWKYPDWERPIKVNMIFPIIYIFGVLFITITPIFVDPKPHLIGILLTLSGIPVYYAFLWTDKLTKILKIPCGETKHFIQKLFLVVYPKED